MAGLSRKSTIYKTLHIDAEESLNGTTVLNTIALQNGAVILRVHDVKEAKEVALHLLRLTVKHKRRVLLRVRRFFGIILNRYYF